MGAGFASLGAVDPERSGSRRTGGLRGRQATFLPPRFIVRFFDPGGQRGSFLRRLGLRLAERATSHVIGAGPRAPHPDGPLLDGCTAA